MEKFIFGVFLILFLGMNLCNADSSLNIKRFAQVDDFLFRGAQPNEDDLIALKNIGIKRVVNFRTEKKLIKKERAQVEKLGMEYVSIPWTIYSPYREDVFEHFFSVIKDRKKTFFHCKRGVERTGVIAAAYKIKYKNYDLQKAWDDVKSFDVKYIWLWMVKNKIKEFYNKEKKWKK